MSLASLGFEITVVSVIMLMQHIWKTDLWNQGNAFMNFKNIFHAKHLGREN